MKFIYYFIYAGNMHIVSVADYGGYEGFLPSECCFMIPPRGYDDPAYQDN